MFSLRTGGLSCSLDIIHGRLGIKILQFFEREKRIFISVVKCYNFLSSNSWIRIRIRIDLKNSDKFQPHHSHLVTIERRCLEDQDMSSCFCLLGRQQPLGFHFILTALLHTPTISPGFQSLVMKKRTGQK
jgi:hypothetical protein